MNEFDACQLYMALKLHFTTKYDYFKYNGKTKFTVAQFNKRKDKYQALVRLSNHPTVSKTFTLRSDARTWARETEIQIQKLNPIE